MNHSCEYEASTGRVCGKIALWLKNGKHYCKKHCEMVKVSNTKQMNKENES